MRLTLLLMATATLMLAANPAIASAQQKIDAKKFGEGVTQLEVALEKAPKDAELLKALSSAYTKWGDSFMFNEQLPPFQKYPQALKHYRSAVKHDAKNEDAKKKAETIENIYRSMGRPVPQ